MVDINKYWESKREALLWWLIPPGSQAPTQLLAPSIPIGIWEKIGIQRMRKLAGKNKDREVTKYCCGQNSLSLGILNLLSFSIDV